MKLTNYKNLNFTGIYLIKNLVSGNCYVGQAKNITSRIRQHLGSTYSESKKDYNTPLHAAFRKYGLDNFELEILQKCDYSELNSLEEYWVSKYDCFKNGYNQTAGGKQSIRHIKLTEEDVSAIKSLLLEAKLSYTQIAEKFNICKDLVYRINVGRAWASASCHYPLRDSLPIEVHQFKGRCVAKRDLITNELIELFPNRNFAAKALGNILYGPHISECCNGNRKKAYGFNWTWEEISEEDWAELLNKFVKEA